MERQGLSRNEYILNLVNDTLNGIDKTDMTLSSIIRKCIRIARLRNDYINLWWLNWETVSISNKKFNEIAQEIAPYFSKNEFESYKKNFALEWIRERSMVVVTENLKVTENQVCALSVGEIEVSIENNKRTASESFPPQGLHPLDLYFEEQSKGKIRLISNTLIQGEEKILERIRQRAHDFLSHTEKQLLFGQLNADIFEDNRQYVDQKLGELCPEALSQFASAYRRTQEMNLESYAQASTSCRRIIKSLADALYPCSDKPIMCADGKCRILSDDKYINRLYQYIHEKTANSSSSELLLAEVEFLCNKIEKLYGLTCKGIHAEISEFEINQCIIQTYLLAGDILRISENQSAMDIEEMQLGISD